MVQLPRNKKQTYWLNSRPQMWPIVFTLVMTLNFEYSRSNVTLTFDHTHGLDQGFSWSDFEITGGLRLNEGDGRRSFMTMTITIWWPRLGVRIYQIVTGVTLLECHLGVLNFLCIFQYSSWCNDVMWLIGNSFPCYHGDQVVTGVPLHVTVATWWSCQSGTQATRTKTCNSRAWICIWFHNTNTIWILQLCCVKSFHVGQNPCPITSDVAVPSTHLVLWAMLLNIAPCYKSTQLYLCHETL